MHVSLRDRPSHFSACNIEKLGMDLGMRLDLSQSHIFTCIISVLLPENLSLNTSMST